VYCERTRTNYWQTCQMGDYLGWIMPAEYEKSNMISHTSTSGNSSIRDDCMKRSAHEPLPDVTSITLQPLNGTLKYNDAISGE